jgi:hypothetical protein
MLQANQRDTRDWLELRALVRTDPDLQRSLAAIEEPGAFAAALASAAAASGLKLGPDQIAARLRPDPLHLERFAPSPPDGAEWPAETWLPVEVALEAGAPQVQWLYFGGKRLTESFFTMSVRLVQWLPFNRLFRYRQSLDDFMAHAQAIEPPQGFIFHMSRCGSTLVSQMIAALPDALAISEAPPLDTILQMCSGSDERSSLSALHAIVGALGRRRNGETSYVVKLDAWHTLALPLLRRAFPNVPWVFLYRDPVEVLVSQVKVRGVQTVPSCMPPALFGLENSVADDEYCAQVLAAICRAVIDHHGVGGGLLVNYNELPEAVEKTILPHFGICIDDDRRAAMLQAARMDAKAPGQVFVSDSTEKQKEATARVRDLAERHLGPMYRALEQLRRAGVSCSRPASV